MKHIRLFENFSGKTIFHLHGLDSQPWPDRVKIMQENGARVIAPQVNYRTEDVYAMAQEIIAKEKPDALVGHSMGALLLYYLSNEHKIDALLFNPAFGSKNAHLLKIPKYEMDLPPFERQMAVVGLKDDVIDPQKQIEMMKHGFVYEEPDLGHRIDPDTFQKYFALFKENFL